MSDESTPHDKLFKETLGDTQLAAAELRAVVPPNVAALVDWSTLTLAMPPTARLGHGDRHHDLLYRAETTTSTNAPVFIHVLFEHQSTEDPRMALRLLDCLVGSMRSDASWSTF